MNLGNVIVTGGLGFIGSHFIRTLLDRTSQHSTDLVINIDFMGYGSNLNNLKDIHDNSKYKHIKASITNYEVLLSLAKTHLIDVIVNCAAETHVDRSIANPSAFIESNVNGVFTLLELCRLYDVEKFVQISTDEVYGDASGEGHLNEDAPLKPNSPYSASKASADLLTRAYNKTYGLKTMITRCSNNFGPNQFPEKLIPKTIIRALKGFSIPIYGDGMQTREWLYVKDHVNAILQVIENSKAGEIYNISTSNEISNIAMVNKISSILLEEAGIEARIEHVSDRPGHDRRYSLDASKIERELGWRSSYSFEDALRETVKWYLENKWWWEPLVTDTVLHPQPWTLNWNSSKRS